MCVQRGLEAKDGVECIMMPAGAVRGGCEDYVPGGDFLMGDLFKEFG